jgi:outer membrane protein assembly factor BamB
VKFRDNPCYIPGKGYGIMNMRVWALAIALAALPEWAAADNVVTYHNTPDRHGAYTIPGLTLPAAAAMHLDAGFHASVQGHVYAQPLFWHPAGGRALVIVATESDVVQALDATTGAQVWEAKLGAPVALSALPCGDIDPDGITGTPVIDPKAGSLYVAALTSTPAGPRQIVTALSLSNGAVLSGWPLDVQAELGKRNVTFLSAPQGSRSALQFTGGALYVSYGGRYGDCGNYHGTVVQFQTSPAKLVASWQTRAKGGGIWAQGGVASDGQTLFATTGNTFGAQGWSDGEAIIRLRPGLARSMSRADYFVPASWKQLDDSDEDLGGTEALPFDIGAAKRVIAFGKDGNAYLVDGGNLGGMGGSLDVMNVSDNAIITAPAILETPDVAMIAFTNRGGKCGSTNITMLRVTTAHAPVQVAWCAAFGGRGAPIVTTTDGSSNAIVWVPGAEGDNLLHGFNAANGEAVFAGGGAVMTGLHHFQTLMAAEGRLYVAADGRVYAFAFDRR